MRFFRYYRAGNSKMFGAPIFVHLSVLIVAVLIAVTAVNSPLSAFAALLSYLSIILVHEAGHAFVARRLGLTVERIEIGLIHGRCYYQSPNFEWHDVLVSWGGVLAQTIVAAVVLTIGATGILDSTDFFGPILIFLGVVNLAIAAFNSLPSAGLDGSTMWRIIPIWLSLRKKKRPKKKRKGRLTVVSKDE